MRSVWDCVYGVEACLAAVWCLEILISYSTQTC